MEVIVNKPHDSKHFETIVVGGGQAGLTVGYHLAKRGKSFVILDANEKIGDAWRNRWDSLRLFTPARYAGLPGFPFPARADMFVSKDDVANYLEQYANRFRLPVWLGYRVDRLWKENERFALTGSGTRFEAENVIVAMADYQIPKTPEFASELDLNIVQLHSHQYRNPLQLRDGGVLVVGVGNSGADIGIEVARTHPTWIAGKESGSIPIPIESLLARLLLVRVVRFLGHHVLTLSTPMGRKLRPKALSNAAPLVRVKPKDLIAAGVERVPRVAGVRNGRPLLADGRILDVANVIWCTGYSHTFPWIDLSVFDSEGRPIHERGVVPHVPGIYFVGLHFLYAMSSATLVGVNRDAEYVVKALDRRAKSSMLELPERLAS
jgi:putative flavoprotein involved in K+ transport